jgi:mono/diheme cytochrome c family protein
MIKLKPPPWFNVILLVLGSTALYTYIGQLVPQKEVLPPQETVMRADMTPEDLVQVGRGIAEGKGLCLTCHTIGKSGALRFPDLEGIATRAAERIPGLDAVHYMARSIYHPDEYVVPGFNRGMPPIDRPPIGLNDQEIVAVIAFLQSLGGTPSVTLETTRADLGVE